MNKGERWPKTYRSWTAPVAPRPSVIDFVARRSAAAPYTARQNRTFLAGACNNKERIEYFAYAVANPKLADAAVRERYKCGATFPLRKKGLSAAARRAGMVYAGENHSSWWRHIDYKFAVYEAGNQGAPRLELQYLLASGSVVLARRFKTVEHYYHLLQDGVHYKVYDTFDDLRRIQRELLADEAGAMRIAANALAFIRSVRANVTHDALLAVRAHIASAPSER